MTDIDTESDDAVAGRCKLLRKALGFQQAATFAEHLEMSPQRWNNVERGLPLSRDLAMILVRRIPGLSLDWLYRGYPDGLSVAMAGRLGALPSSDGKASTKASRGS